MVVNCTITCRLHTRSAFLILVVDVCAHSCAFAFQTKHMSHLSLDVDGKADSKASDRPAGGNERDLTAQITALAVKVQANAAVSFSLRHADSAAPSADFKRSDVFPDSLTSSELFPAHAPRLPCKLLIEAIGNDGSDRKSVV